MRRTRANMAALSADLVFDGESELEEGEPPVLIEGDSDVEENDREAAPARAVTSQPETSERSLCL